MIVTSLPSPAPSICDSLADIDDLEAYLQAKGQLSSWPTPPKDAFVVTEAEIALSDVEEQDGLECKKSVAILGTIVLMVLDYHAACLVAQVESRNRLEQDETVEVVHKILRIAQLPLEVVAIALSVLETAYSAAVEPIANALLKALAVVASLVLAAIWTNDKPPSYTHWSEAVCSGLWSAKEIDRAVLQVLATIGWHLHPSAAAVREAVYRLNDYQPATMQLFGETVAESIASKAECLFDGLPLICINGDVVTWKGEAPNASSSSPHIECMASDFLRLL